MRTSGDGLGCILVSVWLVCAALWLSAVGCLIWAAFHFIYKYW